jgi:beta-fructofuranosidase
MGFGQMEVPQLASVSGRSYLVFSAETNGGARGRRSCGTYYLVGDSTDGSFQAGTLGALEADAFGSTYGGRLVEVDGELLFLAWESTAPDGGFVGAIGGPRRVLVDPAGRLSLNGRPDPRDPIES